MTMLGTPTVTLYPLGNYSFGEKESQPEEDASVNARMTRLHDEYQVQGIRRSVEAVMLVHEHRHPHILVFQIGNAFFKLPSDELKPGEDEVEACKAMLRKRLSPTAGSNVEEQPDWEIGDCISVWWRPNFDNHVYPYVPNHITKPKEIKRVFLVHLQEKRLFAVPRNMKLLAVPLYDLYENSARYGPIISSIPYNISRMNFVCS